jgi:hypothetical protein
VFKKNISDGVESRNGSNDTPQKTPLFFGWTLSLNIIDLPKNYSSPDTIPLNTKNLRELTHSYAGGTAKCSPLPKR